MPFRLDERYDGQFRAKMQFVTGAWMPHMVYTACLRTGVISNTVYIQRAVCEALARDLDLDVDELLDRLPTPRGKALGRWDRNERGQAFHRLPRVAIGPANTDEEVR